MKNQTIKMTNALLLSVILLLLQLNTMAQVEEYFFTTISKQDVTMNTEETIRFDKQEANPVYKNTLSIQVGNISDFLVDRELRFNIPGKNIEYTASVKDFDYFSSTNYLWRGSIINHDGSIVLYCEKGGVFGHIVIDNQEYEIQTIGDASVFLEYDMDFVLKHKCANEADTAHISENETPDEIENNENREMLSCTGLVRILVLYTPAANNAANVQNITTTAIGQINTALNNSDVAYTNVHCSLAKLQNYNYIETDEIGFDVNYLTEDMMVKYWRNLYQADLVIMLTDGNYDGVAGMAREIGPIDSKAYAIVEVDYATANLTFAHEAAHLFGARHQNDPNGTYQHGYYFTKGILWWKKYYRTIMGTYSGTYQRIQYYSNPDVEYDDKPTGSSSSNDNARKLDEEGCVVENFRPYSAPPPPPSVYISGPIYGNNSGTYTWTANGSGGQTPYSYEWYFSLQGVSYYYVGLGSSITAQLPYDSDLYIKVILTDANQDNATDFYYVFNRDADSGGGHKSKGLENDETHNEIPNTIKNIYPNPANKLINIQVYFNEATNYNIKITDLLGRIVYSTKEYIAKGMHTLQINSKDFDNGLYFVQLTVDNNLEIKKLIIQK